VLWKSTGLRRSPAASSRNRGVFSRDLCKSHAGLTPSLIAIKGNCGFAADKICRWHRLMITIGRLNVSNCYLMVTPGSGFARSASDPSRAFDLAQKSCRYFLKIIPSDSIKHSSRKNINGSIGGAWQPFADTPVMFGTRPGTKFALLGAAILFAKNT
jgi:hypothetical protein